MIGFVLWLLFMAYLVLVFVKSQRWTRKQDALLQLVNAAADYEISQHNWDNWDWRYDYLMQHGSIWRYTLVPWQRFDSLYPDESFIVVSKTLPFDVYSAVRDNLERSRSGTED